MVYLFVCYSLFLIYGNVITSYRRTSQFDILHTWRRFFFVPTSFAEWNLRFPGRIRKVCTWVLLLSLKVTHWKFCQDYNWGHGFGCGVASNSQPFAPRGRRSTSKNYSDDVQCMNDRIYQLYIDYRTVFLLFSALRKYM